MACASQMRISLASPAVRKHTQAGAFPFTRASVAFIAHRARTPQLSEIALTTTVGDLYLKERAGEMVNLNTSVAAIEFILHQCAATVIPRTNIRLGRQRRSVTTGVLDSFVARQKATCSIGLADEADAMDKA